MPFMVVEDLYRRASKLDFDGNTLIVPLSNALLRPFFRWLEQSSETEGGTRLRR